MCMTIIHGDCIEVMATMEPDSIDALITDPPYGLEFMGKQWDRFTREVIKSPGRNAPKYKSAKPQSWQAGEPYQSWTTPWATEALRVLKPGGSLLCFGGTRTWHRLGVGMEDAGFRIKDTLMWLYGSGFPKAQDLGKMIDKRAGAEREVVETVKKTASANQCHEGWDRPWAYEEDGEPKRTMDITTPATSLARHWDGYKIGGIKPAWEPILWCVKPPEGTYIDNVLKYGVGAVNVEETRIGMNGDDPNIRVNPTKSNGLNSCFNIGDVDYARGPEVKGRFPANLLLSHSPECRQVGVKRVKNKGGVPQTKEVKDSSTRLLGKERTGFTHYFDPDGKETVEAWECVDDCPVRLLDEQSGELKSGKPGKKWGINDGPAYGAESRPAGTMMTGIGDTGGASRFFKIFKDERGDEMETSVRDNTQQDSFPSPLSTCRFKYCAKASKREPYNDHPTLKPVKLMEHLVRLVTRPGQLVLDPFMGSGTTLVAAIQCGREAIGIEQDRHYCDIAERRVEEVQMGML